MSRSLFARHAPWHPWMGATALGLIFSTVPTVAHAQPAGAADQADAAFKEGQRLLAAGNLDAACPKFAESKGLAPAIGVTLHLADCYARSGRSASAWKEFREAEKMARDKGDKRADIASGRATALEPTLSRLTVEVPPDASATGEQLMLDGAPLASDSWNRPVPVDPGDHQVVVSTPGQPSRTLTVHVEGGGTSATLATALAGPATPAFAPVPDVSAARGGAPPSAPSTSQSSRGKDVAGAPEPQKVPSDHGAARWAGAGMMVAGAAGVGIGTWLVTNKTQDMVNGQLCDPHLQPHAIPEAAVAFAAGGVLLVTGAFLFYVNWPRRAELSLAPSVGPGGGGAVVRGAF